MFPLFRAPLHTVVHVYAQSLYLLHPNRTQWMTGIGTTNRSLAHTYFQN